VLFSLAVTAFLASLILSVCVFPVTHDSILTLSQHNQFHLHFVAVIVTAPLTRISFNIGTSISFSFSTLLSYLFLFSTKHGPRCRCRCRPCLMPSASYPYGSSRTRIARNPHVMHLCFATWCAADGRTSGRNTYG
jgi:hypothetical protein